MDARQILSQIMSQSPVMRSGPPASIPISGRQSPNVEVGPPVGRVTMDDLRQAHGGISDWDAYHRSHLMNSAPVGEQDLDVRTTNMPEVLSRQIQPPGAPGYIQNPGTYIPAQNLNRQIQDSAGTYPQFLDRSGEPPVDASRFDSNAPVGPNWSSSYWSTLGQPQGPSDRWRPGLRYAPWNMRP